MTERELQEARAILQLREEFQKLRIRASNRINAIARGVDEYAQAVEDEMADEPVSEPEMLVEEFARMKQIEARFDRMVAKLTADFPIIEQMTQVKGIGPILAAQVALRVDITRADTVSALWRYAGLSVVEKDGKMVAERPTKGQKLPYNATLKTTMFKIAQAFIKSNSPYRAIYDAEKARQMENGITKNHAHMRAMRKMVKVFLQHLHVRWRELEGLEIREPYVFDKMGHTTYMAPEEFGWPELQPAPRSNP